MRYRIVKEKTGRYRVEKKRWYESWSIHRANEFGYRIYETRAEAKDEIKWIKQRKNA